MNTHVHCLGCTGSETEHYCPRKRTNPAKVDNNYTVCSYMCAHECTKRIYTSTIKKYLSFFLSSCTHSIFSDSHTSLIHTHSVTVSQPYIGRWLSDIPNLNWAKELQLWMHRVVGMQLLMNWHIFMTEVVCLTVDSSAFDSLLFNFLWYKVLSAWSYNCNASPWKESS